MLLFIGAALAATLKVGPTEAYTTIGAAVAAAADGDTISVASGTYAENVDLRGKELALVGAGPYSTFIESTQPLYVGEGSVEGFHLYSTNATGVYMDSGSPTVRELEVEGTALTNGIWVAGGSPTIEECLVLNSTRSGVVATRGSPTVRRTVVVDAAVHAFWLQGTPTLQNSLAYGGRNGITVSVTGGVWEHNVALGLQAAVYTTAAATLLEGVYAHSSRMVDCAGGEPGFSGGLGWDVFTTSGCGASVLSGLTEADPEFAAYEAGASLYELDLSPASGSPMIDAGTGLDVDGTRADLGLFGGIQGAWRDRDGDGVVVVFDCDDHTASRHPGAVERADGADQDCDGLIDEDVPVDTGDTGDTGGGDTGDTGGDTGGTADIDGDGYPSTIDCGDHNIRTYPGAPERYDSVDNDCDGLVDEGTPGGDDDGDGYSLVAGDCDDTDPSTHPDAEEEPRNGVDEDCNGTDESPKHQDNDGDGVTDDTDCDDADPGTHPGATDTADRIDNDCDGVADGPDLATDADGDGVTRGDGDCDDGDAEFRPGAADVPDDHVDQDCTGEDNFDVDRDGYASPAAGGADCDDLRSTTWPGAPEDCDDALDNDCDAEIDEDCGDSGEVGSTGGCGCHTGSSAGLAALALGLLPMILRRRSINS